MSTKKPLSRAERPTRGTVVAQKYRAKLNSLPDNQRATLLEEGMQLIYGDQRPSKTTVRRA